MPILAYTEEPCRQCGQGRNINHIATAKNARILMGALAKKDVAEKMGISPSYFGDLTIDPPRRQWNAELARAFETAVNELK